MLCMSTIQVRANDKTKKKAQHVLKNLGLDLSTAINMYLVQIVVEEGIPFPIRTAKGMTLAKEKELLRAMQSARSSKHTYSSAREAHDAIMRQ